MAIIKELIADEFGSHIGKYSKRLKITQGGDTLVQASVIHLEQVLVISRGVSISADALEICAENGIPVFFMTSQGRPYASMYAAGLVGTTITRREQLLGYYDERGVLAAVAMATGKIENQAATLKYLAKYRKERDPELHSELNCIAAEVRDTLADIDPLQDFPSVDDMRQSLMALEAVAAKRYWAGVRHVIPESYAWHKRTGRGATDPVNSLLNYGYGILYGEIERAVVLAGLDPYAGFIHADRPGKPSLVLDLIEEFRQVAVDRVVFGLVNRNYNVRQKDDGLLTKETRRDFAEKVLERLSSQVPYEGKRHQLRHVIQSQARHFASFLRRECSDYTPFRVWW